MRRLFLLMLLLLLPAVPAYAQGQSFTSRVTQIDTSHYPDVKLYVSVTDAAGTPVGGLNKNDFKITEDGQPVVVDQFTGGGSGPINTVLVIDRSGSMNESGKIEGAQQAAQAFVQQMRPDDQTGLIVFNSETQMLQPSTNDKTALDEAIQDVRPDGGTAIYDALTAGVDALKNVNGRRVLLLLTDGQDCRDTPDCPHEAGSHQTLTQALNYAKQSNQPVYVIGLGDRGGSYPSGIDENVLRRIADETKGEYFYAPTADKLVQLYTRLAGSLQKEYTLTYRSPRPFYDGTRRDIQVNVTGATSADRGYVEPHLINVRSNPLVALMLLLPVLLALLIPALVFRRRVAPVGTSLAPTSVNGEGGHNLNVSAAEFHTVESSSARPVIANVLPPDVPRCCSCDEPLVPAHARFCTKCGAVQQQATVARELFCDQCGQPLRQQSRFCPNCGSPVAFPAMLKRDSNHS